MGKVVSGFRGTQSDHLSLQEGEHVKILTEVNILSLLSSN